MEETTTCCMTAVAPGSGLRAPTLVPVLCLLALSFPVSCSSIVHQSLLERASQFKRIAAVETVAVVLTGKGEKTRAGGGLPPGTTEHADLAAAVDMLLG